MINCGFIVKLRSISELLSCFIVKLLHEETTCWKSTDESLPPINKLRVGTLPIFAMHGVSFHIINSLNYRHTFLFLLNVTISLY